MPLIVMLAGAVGGVALVRFAVRTIHRINRELEDIRMAQMPERAEARVTLRRDPVTGAYRPQ